MAVPVTPSLQVLAMEELLGPQQNDSAGGKLEPGGGKEGGAAASSEQRRSLRAAAAGRPAQRREAQVYPWGSSYAPQEIADAGRKVCGVGRVLAFACAFPSHAAAVQPVGATMWSLAQQQAAAANSPGSGLTPCSAPPPTAVLAGACEDAGCAFIPA